MSILFETQRTSPQSFLISDCVIHLIGPDALQFINSQTTNNVEKLIPNSFQFNSILDLSGKIVASFILSKISEQEFKLSVQQDFATSLLERIEKYHIAEEFEVNLIEEKTFLNINSDHSGVVGMYFFEGDKISFGSSLENLGSDENFKLLQILTGVPFLGKQASPGELINNTYFDELSVDYSKGCFPGQETVAKIQTRRGAAYKPVLGISDQPITELKIDGKVVGKVLDSIEIDKSHYYYLSLLRNYRIDNSEIEGVRIHYYPYISVSKSELAQEFYDTAVELFQSDKDSEAKVYFEKAIACNPTFEDAYESLGVLYGRLEDYTKAIELMEKLKEINPKSMMAYTNLSLFHMKLGHIDTAEDFKSQATLLNFELLGDEAERKKQQEEVEARKLAERDRREGMFLQVLEMDPEDAMANNGMGEILFEKADYLQAREHFQKAISADKKYSVAYLGLAKSLIKLNDTEELAQILTLGMEIAGKNGDLMPANEMQSLFTQYC